MADHTDREYFIPMRCKDLIDVLTASLAPAEQADFRRWCDLVLATFHFRLHHDLERLKDSYAPFDPDADTMPPAQITNSERTRRLECLIEEVCATLRHANYGELGRDALESAMSAVSQWGLNMDVDFNVFEHLHVFARGDVVGKRKKPGWWSWFSDEEVEVPLFRRLALLLKLRPHKRLPRDVDTGAVYLKLFKDVPKMDLEMLLPGTKMRMPRLARGKLGVSLAGSAGVILWQIAQDAALLTARLAQRNPMALWGPLSLVGGYAYKQLYGYQNTKRTYHLQLTQSLYYQNLDNNAGVLTRLADEAEEQECRETVLAYFFLHYHCPDGSTPADLDNLVEEELQRRVHLQVDFEIEDALRKLKELDLVERHGDRYRARPVRQALVVLDRTWDNMFQYNAQDEGRQAA